MYFNVLESIMCYIYFLQSRIHVYTCTCKYTCNQTELAHVVGTNLSFAHVGTSSIDGVGVVAPVVRECGD